MIGSWTRSNPLSYLPVHFQGHMLTSLGQAHKSVKDNSPDVPGQTWKCLSRAKLVWKTIFSWKMVEAWCFAAHRLRRNQYIDQLQLPVPCVLFLWPSLSRWRWPVKGTEGISRGAMPGLPLPQDCSATAWIAVVQTFRRCLCRLAIGIVQTRDVHWCPRWLEYAYSKMPEQSRMRPRPLLMAQGFPKSLAYW